MLLRLKCAVSASTNRCLYVCMLDCVLACMCSVPLVCILPRARLCFAAQVPSCSPNLPLAAKTRVCLCSRCTGYRPILDAFKTFAKTDPKAYTEDAIAAAKGLSPSTGRSFLGSGCVCCASLHRDAFGQHACISSPELCSLHITPGHKHCNNGLCHHAGWRTAIPGW